MKTFNEILDKHTKTCILKDTYNMDGDIEITVNQENNKVVIWAFNYKTDRFVNLGAKRFKKLIEGFKSVASDVYSSDYKYYITLGPIGNASASKPPESEVEELKKRIACLNDIIARLEDSNKKLLSDVDKYRNDYLYYHEKWAELADEKYKRTTEELDGIKKNSFTHNARGAGRRARFSDEQVARIKSLRQEGNTIKEIATEFDCSVGLIHKLINEK